MEKERSRGRDSGALAALRAEYSGQRGGRRSGPERVMRRSAPEDVEHPPLRGWAIWIAAPLVLLALVLAGLAWVVMGVASVASFSVSVTIFKLIFLAPVIGGGLSLPGVLCSLIATRRARKTGARVAAPVTLVLLATVLLVTGLLFGGMVAYPRYRLGVFAQSLQTHCGRVQQVLKKYQNLGPLDLVAKASEISATVNQNKSALQDDQAALNALTAPDNPDAQQLLSDCQTIVATTLDLPNLLKNPAANALQFQGLITTSQEAQRLGDQLKQDIFTPFQPPPGS